MAWFVVTGLCLSRRTVLCTSHAHSCSAWLELLHFVQKRYSCLPTCHPVAPPCLWIWSLPRSLTIIIKVFLLEFEQVFFCELHTPPPLFSGFRRQRSPPHRPVLRRSRNEPCSVTSVGARPSGRAGLPRTSWYNPFGICHNSQNRKEKRSLEL